MKHITKSVTTVVGALSLVALASCAGGGSDSQSSAGADTNGSSIASRRASRPRARSMSPCTCLTRPTPRLAPMGSREVWSLTC